MDVAYQFEQIGIPLAQDGFIPVLKQMPMAAVKGLGIARQQTTHGCGDGHGAGFEQQVKMVGHQRPGVTWCLGFSQDKFQPL